MALVQIPEKNVFINKDQICYVYKSEHTDVNNTKTYTYLVSFSNGFNMELTEAEYNNIK
jgi:hypothetical protein